MSIYNGHDFVQGASFPQDVCRHCGLTALATVGPGGIWSTCPWPRPAVAVIQAPVPAQASVPQAPAYWNGHDFPNGAANASDTCSLCGLTATEALALRSGFDPCAGKPITNPHNWISINGMTHQCSICGTIWATGGQRPSASCLPTSNLSGFYAKIISDELSYAPRNAYIPTDEPKCECGAAAVGTKNFSAGHSAWCPVADSKHRG